MISEEAITENSSNMDALSERPGFSARFWRAWNTQLGASLLLFLILFSYVGPLIYHHSATHQHLLHTLAVPSAQHPLGTDGLGRDVLAQLMVGGQPSLEVGFAAAFVSVVFGILYGLVSGMAGGWVDVILMRIVDIMLSIPAIFILMFLNIVFKPNLLIMIFVLSSTAWLGVSRLVRGEVLSQKNQLYVEAAHALGAPTFRIMTRYFVPNFIGTVLVAATLQVADAILQLAALSFLGLGLPPGDPNWGGLLNNGMNYVFQNSWWLIYPPGIMILISQVSVNLLGDGMRDALETRTM